MESVIEDRLLVQQILAGEKESYAFLVQRYQRKVRGYCQSMLGDPVQADEAAQDSFVKAYQSLAKFRGDSAFSTWLYRITTNHCLDLLRKRKRRPTLSWDALMEQETGFLQKLASTEADAHSSLENRDLAQKILSTLPDDYRTLLTLREAEGLSYEELGKVLHCSVDAVKSRLSRARKAMQERVRHFQALPGVHTVKEKGKEANESR
jgi:RNA polymerase sigma-70 factor, ECF subfamily